MNTAKGNIGSAQTKMDSIPYADNRIQKRSVKVCHTDTVVLGHIQCHMEAILDTTAVMVHGLPYSSSCSLSSSFSAAGGIFVHNQQTRLLPTKAKPCLFYIDCCFKGQEEFTNLVKK